MKDNVSGITIPSCTKCEQYFRLPKSITFVSAAATKTFVCALSFNKNVGTWRKTVIRNISIPFYWNLHKNHNVYGLTKITRFKFLNRFGFSKNSKCLPVGEVHMIQSSKFLAIRIASVILNNFQNTPYFKGFNIQKFRNSQTTSVFRIYGNRWNKFIRAFYTFEHGKLRFPTPSSICDETVEQKHPGSHSNGLARRNPSTSVYNIKLARSISQWRRFPPSMEVSVV